VALAIEIPSEVNGEFWVISNLQSGLNIRIYRRCDAVIKITIVLLESKMDGEIGRLEIVAKDTG
jgi:hypothetical protein